MTFRRQMSVWCEMLHPNVVSLLGVNTKEEPKCIVFEHTRLGDLHQYLARRLCDAYANEAYSSSSQESAAANGAMDARQRLLVGAQTAAGLDYLAARAYVHRDVACRSCYVFSTNTARLLVKVFDARYSMLCVLLCVNLLSRPM